MWHTYVMNSYRQYLQFCNTIRTTCSPKSASLSSPISLISKFWGFKSLSHNTDNDDNQTQTDNDMYLTSLILRSIIDYTVHHHKITSNVIYVVERGKSLMPFKTVTTGSRRLHNFGLSGQPLQRPDGLSINTTYTVVTSCVCCNFNFSILNSTMAYNAQRDNCSSDAMTD